jgi:hypothetical protein
MTKTDAIIAAAARAAHECNRAWCILHGDDSQPHWEDAPDWQRDSAVAGVKGVLAGNGPAEQHEAWMAHKVADGWVYGPVKDAEAKTHPCMVPYSGLPRHQKAKDSIYIVVVSSFCAAAGLSVPPRG